MKYRRRRRGYSRRRRFRRRRPMWRRRRLGSRRIRMWRYHCVNTHYRQHAHNEVLHSWDSTTGMGQYLFWPYDGIIKGTGTNQRLGDQIKPRDLQIKFKFTLNPVYFSNNPGQPQTVRIRMIVGRLRQSTEEEYHTVTNLINDLFGGNGPTTWDNTSQDLTNCQYSRSHDYPIRIISDKVYSVSCATGLSKQYIKTIKLRRPIAYVSDIVPNPSVKCYIGSIFVFFTADLPLKDNLSPVVMTCMYRANWIP